VLSQDEPCDATVNFDTYRIILQQYRTCGLLKTHLFCKSAYWPFKVIQGHLFWYQSKARMQLSISPSITIVTLVLSCTVSEILQFFVCSWPHPCSTRIYAMFPLDQIAHLGVSPSRNLKLISREIIFEVFQHVWKTYLNVTDRRTIMA